MLPGKGGEVNTATIDDMASKDNYTYLASQIHFEGWTDEFCGNERGYPASRSMSPWS